MQNGCGMVVGRVFLAVRVVHDVGHVGYTQICVPSPVPTPTKVAAAALVARPNMK